MNSLLILLSLVACILMVGISGLSVRRVVEDLFKVTVRAVDKRTFMDADGPL